MNRHQCFFLLSLPQHSTRWLLCVRRLPISCHRFQKSFWRMNLYIKRVSAAAVMLQKKLHFGTCNTRTLNFAQNHRSPWSIVWYLQSAAASKSAFAKWVFCFHLKNRHVTWFWNTDMISTLTAGNSRWQQRAPPCLLLDPNKAWYYSFETQYDGLKNRKADDASWSIIGAQLLHLPCWPFGRRSSIS